MRGTKLRQTTFFPMAGPGDGGGVSHASVCMRLDAVVEEALEAWGHYQQQQKDLEALLREGRLALTKARVTSTRSPITATGLTELQYDLREHDAHMRVACRCVCSTASAWREGEEKDSDDKTAQVGCLRIDQPSSLPPSEPSLRQRRHLPTPTVPPSHSPPSSDPLTWFGGLVPPSLRTAQATFRRAIEGAIVAADTAHRIASLCQEFEVLSARKKVLRHSDS